MTDPATHYRNTIESIQSGDMAFNMFAVFSYEKEAPVFSAQDGEPTANFCGTAGCILGHALAANEAPEHAVGLLLDNQHPAEPGVTGEQRGQALLRLSKEAADALFYEQLELKNDPRTAATVLGALQGIAKEREVQKSDVLAAEAEAAAERGLPYEPTEKKWAWGRE